MRCKGPEAGTCLYVCKEHKRNSHGRKRLSEWRVEEMIRNMVGSGRGWADVKTLAHVVNETRGLMDSFDLICVVKEYLQLLHCEQTRKSNVESGDKLGGLLYFVWLRKRY